MPTPRLRISSCLTLLLAGCALTDPEPPQARVSPAALASVCPDELAGKPYYGNRELLGREHLKWFLSGMANRPKYPRPAAAKGQPGVVLAAIAVSARGNVEGTSIVCAYPAAVFEQSVLQAVRANSYPVYQKDGVALPYEIVVRFLFGAEGDDTLALRP